MFKWVIILLVFGCEAAVRKLLFEENAAGCSVDQDLEKCLVNVYCYEYIDQFYRQQSQKFVRLGYNNYGNMPESTFCHYISIDFKEYFEINFELRQANPSNDVLNNVGNSIIYKAVTTLDLRNNGFIIMPEIQDFDNLRTFSIAENALTTAMLSNRQDLPALQNVDYSKNNINSIQINKEQFVFSSLKKLNLSRNYLVQIPNLAFESIISLEVLDLSLNYIDVIGMLTFEGLNHLNHLNMSNNRISDISNSLFRFKELVELDMSHNKIQKISNNDFEYLVKLKRLDLSGNFVKDIYKTAFFKNILLTFIDISNNNLEVVDKDLFSKISNLVYVDISKNKFKGLPKYLFKDKNIERVLVKDNILEGTIEKGLFEGLKMVTELDLSFQHLNSIDDLAFFGLTSLLVLQLNDNSIQTVSNKAFYSLQSLVELNLSKNKLVNIDFDKKDLYGLQILSMGYNMISEFNKESLYGLHVLQYLDISNNNISKLLSHSFSSQKDLITLRIDNNPISGILYENSFDGLISLPSLDVSGCLLTEIKNSSFTGMNHLKFLNSSNSQINKLEYNSFKNTGKLETIDLSNNYLQEFYVNTSELENLHTLILNKNLLKELSTYTFSGLYRLNILQLSYNKINKIEKTVLKDQTDLRSLDLSYNIGLNFDDNSISHCYNLYTLNLSSVGEKIKFQNSSNKQLKKLRISDSFIINISELNLSVLQHLEDLNLNKNYISNVTTTAFLNLHFLSNLDLSFNKITFVQPGCFKDTILHTLNISHNFLTVLNYGIFRGLIYLNKLDISFNYISNLKSERFFEVKSLKTIIADHNKINYVDPEEFEALQLSCLSIGDNPLPCEMLIKLKDRLPNLELTSISLNETSNDNIFGVTCNIYDKDSSHNKFTTNSNDTQALLSNIRDILLGITNKNTLHDETDVKRNDIHNYEDDKIITILNSSISNVSNSNNISFSLFKNEIKKNYEANREILDDLLKSNNLTNTILEKIRLAFLKNTLETNNPRSITQDDVGSNVTLIEYINKIRDELKNHFESEKQSLLNKLLEIDRKFSLNPEHSESTQNISSHLFSKLTNTSPEQSEPKSFLFIEICVGLNFFIVLCFALFQFYKSRLFIPSRRSLSTQPIGDSISNMNL